MGNHLSERAEAEINDLQRQGITLTLDEIIWLNDLGRKVENPEGSRPCLAIGEPIPAGSDWLWPFTIAGIRWYTRVLPWFDGDDETEGYALAYSLIHGHTKGAFTYINDFDSAKEAIYKWADQSDSTPEELESAMVRVLPDNDTVKLEEDEDNEKENLKKATNWDDTIMELCMCVGGTPEFWQYGVSSDYALKQLDMWRKQKYATGKEIDPNDPYVMAVKNFGRAVLSIKRQQKE